MGASSKKILSYITGKKCVVVNTHLHPDHIGGNKYFLNAEVIGGGYTHDEWKQEAGSLPYPNHILLPGEEKTIRIGKETVVVRNMGRAHSQHDCIIFLKHRKFLITGDLLFNGMHPVLFSGISSSTKWREALETLMDEFTAETVLPGHGPLTDHFSLLGLITYFNDCNEVLLRPAIRKDIARKYNHLKKIPFMTGFNRTLRFMKHERTNP
jgi:glyoxylase-like metal-dependent hydrolase (beta-lactamase superfamily II)